MNRRARIALVVDAPDWAFDGIARAIQPTLNERFDTDILYLCDYEPAWASTPTPGTALEFFHELFCGAYDLIHCLGRPFCQRVIDPAIAADPALRPPQAVLDRVLRRPLTMNVHDHLIVERADERERARADFSLVAAYFASSATLCGELRKLPGVPAPTATIPDGVDASAFRQVPAEHLRATNRPLRVGWVGNADWGQYLGYHDHKGVKTIIEPAVTMAAARGVAVTPAIHDRARSGWLPRTDIVAMMESFDIYTCASLHEGTATSSLEAMACGIPLVATRVGILPDVAGPLQAEFLVERTPDAFAAALERLAANPDLRVAIGAENRQRAEQLTWEHCGRRWAAFFGDVLGATRARTGIMSDAAVWERTKAWSARVNQVVGADTGD